MFIWKRKIHGSLLVREIRSLTLARALYEVHTAHESQPALAIQETLQRMSDNTDRRAILLAARISAEALARKRLIIIKSGKAMPQQQLTLFDQLQLLKSKNNEIGG